jgi:hypothetical protein
VRVVDQVPGTRARVDRHLAQPLGVRGVLRTDDDHHVALGRDLLDHFLAVLRRVADVVARRRLEQRQPGAQPFDGVHGLVDRQRGLRQPHDLRRIAHGDAVDRVRPDDQLDVCGRLAGGTHDLLVPLVPDEQDVVVVGGVPARLHVHLRHQGAGGVDRLERTPPRLLVHLRRDPVRGEDDDRALRHLVVLLDEDRPPGLQRRHHVPVVDDLLADVNRRPVELERLLDGLHRPVDAGAVAPGLGEQDTL